MTELEYSEFIKSETDLKRETDIIRSELGIPYMTDRSLEHHGIKGMKWGVRRSPEQLGYKKKAKQKSPGIFEKAAENRKKKAAADRKEKEKRKTAKEDEKKRLTVKEKEELRKKLLNSTDPKLLYKHRDLLTANELQDRINRINKENDLKKMADGPAKKSAMKEFETTMQSLSNIANSLQKGYIAYNTIHNGILKNMENTANRAKAAEKQQSSDKNQDEKPESKQQKNQPVTNYRQQRDALSHYLDQIGASDKTMASVLSTHLANEREKNFSNYLDRIGVAKDSASAINRAFADAEKIQREAYVKSQEEAKRKKSKSTNEG